MKTEYISHDRKRKVTIYSYPRRSTASDIHEELMQRYKGGYSFSVARNRKDVRANGLLDLIPDEIDFRKLNVIFVKR